MKLEELARQSTSAARVSVAHLEVPPLGSPSPKRSWTPLVAGVAVTALVVGGLAVLARDRTSSDAPADSALPTVADVPRLGLQLDGWTVSFAGTFDDLSAGASSPDFAYYGDASSTEDPYGAGDLLIAAFVGADPAAGPSRSGDASTVELRGTTATISTGKDQGLPVDATSLDWYEVAADGTATEIVMISRSFDVAALTDVAEALTIEAGKVTPGPEFGLDRVATAAGTPFDPMRRSGEGFVVAYQNAASSDFAVISSTRGRLADEARVMRWWTDQVTDVEIDGRPGFIAAFDGRMADLGKTLTWSPVDGVIATVSHLGADDTLDVTALANAAFEIDDATWATYLAATDAARAGANDYDEIYGQGDGSVGDAEYSWVLGLQGSSLCFNIQVGDAGTGSCQERNALDVPPGGARTVDNGFGDTLAHVVIAADPSVDDVVETHGGAYTVERVEADGISWFVAIGDTTVQPSFDVIVDGVVVDTVEAAVEEAAEVAPALQEVTAAVELGVADMNIAAFGNVDGRDWWIGERGPDLCLVTADPLATADPSETAFCSVEGDLTVFRPVAIDGGEQTFVVVRDLPTCVEAVALDVDGAASVGGGNTIDHRYEIWSVPGVAAGWNLLATVAGGEAATPLADVEGTTDWPADLCAD
jgi:hypothetical protein